MGVSSYFKYHDSTCKIQDVNPSVVRQICRNQDILVDVYGMHYYKMQGIDKIVDMQSKFRAIDTMLNTYYSRLDLQYKTITFVLDGKLHGSKLNQKLKRIAGKVSYISNSSL